MQKKKMIMMNVYNSYDIRSNGNRNGTCVHIHNNNYRPQSISTFRRLASEEEGGVVVGRREEGGDRRGWRGENVERGEVEVDQRERRGD